jgi:hypothetical protein
MKALSVAGTAAMFLVGGGILVHGLPIIDQAIDAAVHGLPGPAQTLLPALADMLLGMLAGALVLGAVTLVQRLRG